MMSTAVAADLIWPLTRNEPLPAAVVESQNRYMTIASPSASWAGVNRAVPATTLLRAADWLMVDSVGGVLATALTVKLFQSLQAVPSYACTHSRSEPVALVAKVRPPRSVAAIGLSACFSASAVPFSHSRPLPAVPS